MPKNFQTFTTGFILVLAQALHAQAWESVMQIRDVQSAQAALNRGTSPNVKNADGYTWLHLSMAIKSKEIAKMLLDRGADPNALTTAGQRQTPLDEAISSRFPDGIRLLAERGANLESSENFNGETALHVSASKPGEEFTAMMDLLIEKGAKLESQNKFGETPIFAAIQAGRNDRVKLLIAKGASLTARAKGGTTPFMSAAVNKNYDAQDILIKAGADIRAQDDDGANALILVIRTGNDGNEKLESIQNLLKRKVDPDQADNDGNTAVYWATIHEAGDDYLKALLEAGASPDLKNKKGNKPLDQAIINGATSKIKILGKITKDLNELDKYGSTRLISAAINKKTDVARMLIEAGADVNAKDKWGKTALYHARLQKADAIVRLLEARGAQ